MRRQSVRYAVQHPIELSVVNERTVVRHHVHSLDLSRTGMYLAMVPLAVGTVVKLSMATSDDRRLHTRGTIVREDGAGVGVALHEPCEPADELFGLGIEQLVRRSTQAQLVRPANQPAALAGELSVIGLPAILTMLEHERQTGRLVLTGECILWIDVADGRIVDAGMADVVMPAHAVVMMALDQRRGRFELFPCSPDQSLGLMPITHLLLEHARRVDEGAPGAPSIWFSDRIAISA